MNFSNLNIIIASDVSGRDGIGIEVYLKDELILEIFRDDTLKERTFTFYRKDIPLEVIENCIACFKKEIPWDFLN